MKHIISFNFSIMNNSIRVISLYAFLFLILLLVNCCRNLNESANGLSFVDTNIGGVGYLLKSTRPTVHLPNQIIRMAPVRNHYLDDQIRGFQLSQETFNIMPYTGSLEIAAPVSAWDEQLEEATPYYFFNVARRL